MVKCTGKKKVCLLHCRGDICTFYSTIHLILRTGKSKYFEQEFQCCFSPDLILVLV